MKLFWYNVKVFKDSKEKGLWYSPFWKRWDELIVNKQRLYDIYKNNSDIKVCVRKIANYIGKEWFTLLDKQWEPIEYQKAKDDYDLLESMLSNPTFSQTKIEVVKHLTTSWELYLLPTTVPWKKEVNWFQVIHPKTVTKVIEDGRLTKFRQVKASTYKQYSAIETKDKTNRMQLYRYEKHTDNEINGMGIVEWLLYDALSDFSASKRNYYFFENDNTPPSILQIEKDLTDDQIQLLVEQIQERHSGPENAHKMFMGVWVKDVKAVSFSPKDMEHIQQRKLTIDKVTAAYWVPRAILWYTESVNYNNAISMYKEFVEWTINPFQSFFEFIVNDFLSKYKEDFAKKYYVQFNVIDPTDQFEVAKLRMQKVAMWWLTIDERRVAEWREPYWIDESEKPIILWSHVLLEDIWFSPVLDNSNT